MLREKSRTGAVYGLIATFLLNSTIPPEVYAGGWPFQSSGEMTTIDHLAKKIDHVQKQLDDFGTIVAKSPDVWGESRLLQHREQFEQEMSGELNKFRETIQGAESTRDSAFLASALSLSNVLSGGTGSTTPPASSTSNTQVFIAEADELVPSNSDLNSPTSRLVPRADGYGPKFSNQFSTGVSTTTPQQLGISLEPTVYLDQKRRYLDHLNALRRLNEGDDTADSPGYALNLVRIPVSVMPGRQTRKGYGAEISVSVSPYVSDELLPEAFRNFVINGVVDRIAPTVTQIVNDDDRITALEAAWKKYSESIKATALAKEEVSALSSKKRTVETVWSQLQNEIKNGNEQSLENFIGSQQIEELQLQAYVPTIAKAESLKGKLEKKISEYSNTINDIETRVKTNEAEAQSEVEQETKQNLRSNVASQLTSGTFSGSHRAYPPSLANAISGTSLASITLLTNEKLKSTTTVHLEDVRRFLRLELEASYNMLSQDELQDLWLDTIQLDELKNAIIEVRDFPSGEDPVAFKLSRLRYKYITQVTRSFPGADFTPTLHLGWHILVESVMLNEQLIEDMKSINAHKNCCQAPPDGLTFYGPNPSLEARYKFKEYISCRWPVQVFALDPVTDDQNIGEAFSQRRELQLAAAIAASQGIFGAQSLSRFVRRLEYDLETIQLNRTAIGFSHGHDTFGWRFYPRIQAPPAPGTIKAFGQTLLGGQSREKRLKEQFLEPATRECTALVVMPSFVPYLMVDVKTNWFRLAPGFKGKAFKREMDLQDAVGFSKDVTTLRQLAAACKEDAHLYRDGETHRLLRAVDNIERQLPLQTSYVQIPYENNLSGFDIFNNGVTDLGPQLIDWYGGPGVLVGGPGYSRTEDIHNKITGKTTVTTTLEKRQPVTPELKPTTLFLVGRNFSSLGEKTRIIAGGIDVSKSRILISRSVMQVTIPPNVVHDGKHVDIHIATPHGVTSHMMVDVKEISASTSTTQVVAKITELEKAVAEVQNRYPIQFNWLNPKVTGCIDILKDTSKKPPIQKVNLLISEDVKIGIDATILPSHADSVMLTATISISKDGKDFSELKNSTTGAPSTIRMHAQIRRGTDTFSNTKSAGIVLNKDVLAGELHKVILAGNYLDNDIKAIKLTGHAQISLTSLIQPLPVYHVNGELTITTSRCVNCCPPATPDTGTTSTPTAVPTSLPESPQEPAALPLFVEPAAPVIPPPPALHRSSMSAPPASRPIRKIVRQPASQRSGFAVLESP